MVNPHHPRYGSSPTPARTTDPDTSHAAADSVDPTDAWDVKQWILFLLYSRPDTHESTLLRYRGMRVAKPDMPDVSDSGFRTRCSELVKAGRVRDSGKRKPLRSGRNAIVWEIVRDPHL